jgi:hypothetical protein
LLSKSLPNILEQSIHKKPSAKTNKLLFLTSNLYQNRRKKNEERNGWEKTIKDFKKIYRKKHFLSTHKFPYAGIQVRWHVVCEKKVREEHDGETYDKHCQDYFSNIFLFGFFKFVGDSGEEN